MGIVNINADSFYAGSRVSADEALKRIGQMESEGANMIDIGAMSSRPGASVIPPEEEWDRLSGIIPAVKQNFPDLILSVDTLHSSTALKALDLGTDIINDISGGTYDDAMLAIVGRYQAPFVIMHMQGRPENMQVNPHYDNVVTEVFDFFVHQIAKAEARGVTDLILDPGFGFGKTMDHNYELLRNLHSFEILRYPILAGVSRKGMIQKLLQIDAANALNGTTAVHMLALLEGARILRVHDVKEAVECVKVWHRFSGTLEV